MLDVWTNHFLNYQLIQFSSNNFDYDIWADSKLRNWLTASFESHPTTVRSSLIADLQLNQFVRLVSEVNVLIFIPRLCALYVTGQGGDSERTLDRLKGSTQIHHYNEKSDEETTEITTLFSRSPIRFWCLPGMFHLLNKLQLLFRLDVPHIHSRNNHVITHGRIIRAKIARYSFFSFEIVPEID